MPTTPPPSPITLPDTFLWGTSTSAHQIEGNNTNSDWWRLERSAAGLIQEPSGDAADSYHRWPEDMDLLADLGFTDYRFSIEWARIEPAPGEYSRAALAHYRRMVEGALERGLRPMVTLHHFTLPHWFAERGGWRAPDAVDLFARYAQACAPVLTSGVRHVCTINEPNMVAVMVAAMDAVQDGEAFPHTGLPLPDEKTSHTLIAAHRAATAAVKKIDGDILTGWTVANQAYLAEPGAQETADAYRHPREDLFLEAARHDDWIGVQAYTSTRIGPEGPLPVPDGAERTLTGWEFRPEALGIALRHTAEVVGPTVQMIVTENGIATDDDSRRTAYLAGALGALAAAIDDGLNIGGYLHWSLLDNYEWGSYRPTFGLIAVDKDTFTRTPKPSAAALGAIGRTRLLPAAP
ncbi:family 1 glycosylhydrolase [Streptomyces sp. NPDC056500]|uniref:family 1 glycosylhydrolase n=1 Tax=Streptomyces sp. NPDC056500 TaxID=3345840 RepID=UPI0036B2FE22